MHVEGLVVDEVVQQMRWSRGPSIECAVVLQRIDEICCSVAANQWSVDM